MRRLQSTQISFQFTLGTPFPSSNEEDTGTEEWALLQRLEASGYFGRSDSLVEHLPPTPHATYGEEVPLVDAFSLDPEFESLDGQVVFALSFDFGDRFSPERLELVRAFALAELARPEVAQGKQARLVGIVKTEQYTESVRSTVPL